MSDTPRTHAARFAAPVKYKEKVGDIVWLVVMAELAEGLERELAEAERDISWVRDILAQHGYDGPLGPGCCPLEDWLNEWESARAHKCV